MRGVDNLRQQQPNRQRGEVFTEGNSCGRGRNEINIHGIIYREGEVINLPPKLYIHKPITMTAAIAACITKLAQLKSSPANAAPCACTIGAIASREAKALVASAW